MRISDWSSDVCSSDLPRLRRGAERGIAGRLPCEIAHGRGPSICRTHFHRSTRRNGIHRPAWPALLVQTDRIRPAGLGWARRSEEHTSELQSLMRISYAVFCLKKKKQQTNQT